MTELKHHSIVLEGTSQKGIRIRLRPMTDKDWDLLLKWNNDPEVLYYAEGDDITGYTLAEVKNLYCSVCAKATCFIIEADGMPIGECWLQEMNLERVLEKYPDMDVRRIDLAIGEKDHWNKGIGTSVIRMLTEFGFLQEKADLIYEPGIADYNPRSLKAFQKAGYEILAAIEEEPGGKAKFLYDLVLTRDRFQAKR
jgi:RimJ/RimL family protein N-acetyltransferase